MKNVENQKRGDAATTEEKELRDEIARVEKVVGWVEQLVDRMEKLVERLEGKSR